MSQPKVELNSTLNNLDTFNKYATRYDQYAHVQKDVAYAFFQFLKQYQTFLKKHNTTVLEIGAGTGLFSELHLNLWKDSAIDLSDPQIQMLEVIDSKLLSHKQLNKIRLLQNSLEGLVGLNKKYDVVLHSFVAQWFNPISWFIKQKDLLVNNGIIAFTLPINGSFQIWREQANRLNVPFTANKFYEVQDITELFKNDTNVQIIDYIIQDYYSPSDNALDFFREIKYIGAGTQNDGIRLNSKDFLKLVKYINNEFSLGKRMNYKTLFFLAKKIS